MTPRRECVSGASCADQAANTAGMPTKDAGKSDGYRAQAFYEAIIKIVLQKTRDCGISIMISGDIVPCFDRAVDRALLFPSGARNRDLFNVVR